MLYKARNSPLQIAAHYCNFKTLRMKRSLLFITIPAINLILLCSLSGCSGNSEKKEAQAVTARQDTNKVLSKPPSSFTDTLIIDSPGAIFYDSDSIQLVKTKSINTKMAYETMVHECFYMMRNAKMVLKQYWPKLKITGTTKARYLLFIKSDKSQTYIDLNAKNDMCGMFMFDGKKEPELADMTNVETELGNYFEQ